MTGPQAGKSDTLHSLHVHIHASSTVTKTVWPSGLRRWLKAPFRKGVGSNPTAVIYNCREQIRAADLVTYSVPDLLTYSPTHLLTL